MFLAVSSIATFVRSMRENVALVTYMYLCYAEEYG